MAALLLSNLVEPYETTRITGAAKVYEILLCTDIAHEKKITCLPQVWILTLSLLNLTSPNFCIQDYTREHAAHQEN